MMSTFERFVWTRIDDLLRPFSHPPEQFSLQFIEGQLLEIKVPTIWTDEKHSQEEAEPGRNSDVEKVIREKIRDGESQKREDEGARKGRKVAKQCVFPMICVSGVSVEATDLRVDQQPS